MEDNNEFQNFKEEIDEKDRQEEKFTLMIEQLKNENFNIRLYCVKNIENIAENFGTQ